MAEYIEREAVFDKLAVIYGLARTDQRAVITDALREVSHIPAADVQPVKRGRWIITDDVEHFIAICSECGRTEDSRDIKDMPYCHCGARMIKEEEENDTL